jgi:hypothetical protein
MIWNTETMSWKQGRYIGNPPTQRYGHTATAIGPHLLIFGGWEFSKAQNEIIVLREYTQSQPSGGALKPKLSKNSLSGLAPQNPENEDAASEQSMKEMSNQIQDYRE